MAIFKRKNRGGIVYIIDYYDASGRRIREVAGHTRRQAEKALAARKGDIVKGKFSIQDVRRAITFGVLAEIYIEHAKDTKKSWKRDITSLKNILPFFENKRLSEISPFNIVKYMQARRENVSGATVNRELALMKSMFNLAIKWKKARSNPVKEVKFYKENPPRVRFLEVDEIARLLECCAPQLKPVVITALNTGLRKNEILGIKWTDVDLERGIIYIDDSKGGEPRQIMMNGFLLRTITKLQADSGSEFVFLNKHGKPYRDILPAFKRALRKARIYDFRFHDLRHTFASHLAMNRTPLQMIQKLLGHKSPAMTTRYAHLSADFEKDTLENLQRKLFTSHNMDTKEKSPKSLKREKH